MSRITLTSKQWPTWLSAQSRHAIVGCLAAFALRVVARNLRNAHSVLVKHTLPASVLDTTMLNDIAPRGHGSLVSPEGKRDQLAFIRHALKALDGDKPVGLLDKRHECRCHIEVSLLFARLRPRLKDHDDHTIPPAAHRRLWICGDIDDRTGGGHGVSILSGSRSRE